MKLLFTGWKEPSVGRTRRVTLRGCAFLLCVLMLMLTFRCENKKPKTATGAAFDGDAEFLREWLASGGDPNLMDKDGNTLLWLTAGPKGGFEAMTILLEAGADPNLCKQGNYSPLMNAADWGRIEMVKALVEAGADLDYRSSTGKDVFYCARVPYRKEIVEYLEQIKKTNGANSS